jgi:hypothetical protein
LLFCSVTVQNISVASKKEKKREKNVVQKDTYLLLPHKTKQGKLDKIISKLVEI